MLHHVRITISARSVWVVGLNILALAGIVWVGWQTWGVISWILIALFLAVALHPLTVSLTRHGMKYGLAVAVIVLSLFALLAVLIYSFVPMFVEQTRQLIHNAPTYLEEAKHVKWIATADERFGLFEKLHDTVSARLPHVAGPVLSVLSHVLAAIAATFTILTLTMFMLLFGGDLFQSVLRWFPPEKRPRIGVLANQMTDSVGGYIAGTFFISATGAVVSGVSLAILGVPYFLTVALAMLVLCVIPWIGSAIGAVLVFTTALATVGVRRALIALVIMLLWQQVEHRLAPLVQAKTVKMNALLLSLIALIATSLAGLLGTVLAVPFAGAIQVLVSDVLRTREERWRTRSELSAPEVKEDRPQAPH